MVVLTSFEACDRCGDLDAPSQGVRQRRERSKQEESHAGGGAEEEEGLPVHTRVDWRASISLEPGLSVAETDRRIDHGAGCDVYQLPVGHGHR